MDIKFTHTNVLKMYVCNENWVPKKYRGSYKKLIPKDELDYNSWWYLHGELESIVGYDKAYTINCKSAGYSKETVNYSCICGNTVKELSSDGRLTRWEMHVNGIIPVQVKGVDEPCVGYFWTIEHSDIFYEGISYPYWDQRGLVCLESDVVGRKYAEECMRRNAEHL